jgi:CRISPR/Cas system type I-B associated protein Csh2 (Cas7 group RAMP superfamily)
MDGTEFKRDHWDVSTFGAVAPRVDNAERTAGAVLISHALSVTPIATVEFALTRVCGMVKEKKEEKNADTFDPDLGAPIETEDLGIEDSAPERANRANMGSQYHVPFALYEFDLRFIAGRAEVNQITSKHLEQFFLGLTNGFEQARAANRTGVDLHSLCLFQFHGLRGTTERSLLSRIGAECSVSRPTSVQDFSFRFDTDRLPEQISTYTWKDGKTTKNGVEGIDQFPTETQQRWIGKGYIQCVMSNPNGDPDRGGQPRVDPWSGKGIISSMSIKRVIRDFVSNEYGVKLFMERGADLARSQAPYVKAK